MAARLFTFPPALSVNTAPVLSQLVRPLMEELINAVMKYGSAVFLHNLVQ